MLSRFYTLPDTAQRLSWVLGGLTVAMLPHVGHLPYWVLLLAGGACLWRFVIELRGWQLPSRVVRTAVAILMLACVAGTYRTLNGLEAGTAFLALLSGAKMLETRGTRDLTMLVFVSYVLLFAAFLYEQSLLRLPYLIFAAWALTAMLLKLHDANSAIPAREALSTSGKMLIQAIPVAILLFVFFPRLPGQFWALPARGSAISGLSDTLSPGDVSELSLSGAIAFRVKFDGDIPPPAQRYWRGPVLHSFDGRTWRRASGFNVPPQELIVRAPGVGYRMTLEPTNRRWIPALDVPIEWPENRAVRTADWQLLAHEPITTLTSFRLRSATAYEGDNVLPNRAERTDTSLPSASNPRSRALAQELRAREPDDTHYVQAVLRKFHDEKYFYTLEPPRLEANAIDDFLFNTRRGFCEHFASAFTVLMRAAGIPARVVTGYQGGEINQFGGYMIVRQSDAHAWSEVWLQHRGWVRIDPTAAVAPERIERGLDASVGADEPVPGRFLRQSELLTRLRFAWDAANTFWNDSVVGYDAREQTAVLKWFGFDDADWQTLGIALTIIIVAFFTILTLYLAWQFRPRSNDLAAQSYSELCRKLARHQLAREVHEGPNDYLTRIATTRPELARELKEIQSLYIGLRYEPHPMPQLVSRLRYLVDRLGRRT